MKVKSERVLSERRRKEDLSYSSIRFSVLLSDNPTVTSAAGVWGFCATGLTSRHVDGYGSLYIIYNNKLDLKHHNNFICFPNFQLSLLII